jgi:hypothetical protein
MMIPAMKVSMNSSWRRANTTCRAALSTADCRGHTTTAI